MIPITRPKWMEGIFKFSNWDSWTWGQNMKLLWQQSKDSDDELNTPARVQKQLKCRPNKPHLTYVGFKCLWMNQVTKWPKTKKHKKKHTHTHTHTKLQENWPIIWEYGLIGIGMSILLLFACLVAHHQMICTMQVMYKVGAVYNATQILSTIYSKKVMWVDLYIYIYIYN